MDHHPGQPTEADGDGGTPTKIGPFSVGDPFGRGFVIPGPLTAGRPKPEPEERWTLGPEHADEPAEDLAHSVPVEPVAPRRPGLLDRLRRRSRSG